MNPPLDPDAPEAAVSASPGSRVGVLTGGRLTLEDAYAYAKFARAVLGTNNIDFRSRPHSQEEAEFLAARRGRHRARGHLRRPRAGRPGAAGRLRAGGGGRRDLPAAAQGGPQDAACRSATLAPYLSNGNHKLDATLVATAPGAEASVLGRAAGAMRSSRTPSSVILVGERAALASGTLTAVQQLAERTGARLAWVPRRAGDRGAVEAGCLPNLLPGGRPVDDPAARVDTSVTWGTGTLPRRGRP